MSERRRQFFDYARTILQAGNGSGEGGLLFGNQGAGASPDFPGGPHRIERARHQLGGARSAHVVGGFRLEQLSVGENDPQLVVQLVKQQT